MKYNKLKIEKNYLYEKKFLRIIRYNNIKINNLIIILKK